MQYYISIQKISYTKDRWNTQTIAPNRTRIKHVSSDEYFTHVNRKLSINDVLKSEWRLCIRALWESLIEIDLFSESSS